MTTMLFRAGNWCFRVYIRRVGREIGPARVLDGVLEWLRWYADTEGLDFQAALASSGRRGSTDFRSARVWS
jgi:hypothetical protein